MNLFLFSSHKDFLVIYNFKFKYFWEEGIVDLYCFEIIRGHFLMVVNQSQYRLLRHISILLTIEGITVLVL